MMRARFCWLLCLMTLLSGGVAARAQTGPIKSGPPETNPFNVQPGLVPQMNLLSPDAVAGYLRKHKYRVEMRKGADGRPILAAQIQQNGWKFDIEIEFTPNLQGFYLICPLGNAARLTPAQLKKILETNHQKAPAYFAIRPGDQRLVFEDFYGAQGNEASFLATLNRYLGNIQATHSVWDSNRWTAPVPVNVP